MDNNALIESIKRKIYTFRGKKVMLDSDLAELYCIKTKILNQAVKRNIGRFPEEFMFQLSDKELNNLRSQFVTLEHGRGKHRKYLPYVFTEQGVAMLSSVLKSGTAIDISIQIINAFVAMRRFLSLNAPVFQRLDHIELKQLDYDKKFEQIFNAIEDKSLKPSKGIFFDGQVFEAYRFVADLVRTAKKSIILIDNYLDDSVLMLFSKREKNVSVIIYTRLNEQLDSDLKKFNCQYDKIEVRKFDKSHDRFMIIDDKEVYHFGASLKDLGKKWFAFSRFDKDVLEILRKLE